MARIREHFFLFGLVVAMTAVSSALASLSLGYRLHASAQDRGRALAQSTRLRLLRTRARLARRLRSLV